MVRLWGRLLFFFVRVLLAIPVVHIVWTNYSLDTSHSDEYIDCKG